MHFGFALTSLALVAGCSSPSSMRVGADFRDGGIVNGGDSSGTTANTSGAASGGFTSSVGGAGGGGAPPSGVAGNDGGASAHVGGAPAEAAGGAQGGAEARAGAGGSAGGEPWPCPRGTPCVIMPLGDSITYGYGSTNGGGYRVPLLTRALADKHSVTFVGSVSSGPDTLSGQPFPKGNEGHSGYSIDDSSSTKGISPLVDQALATYRPNVVLLMIGTNDMHYKLDLTNAPTRLGKLLDQITLDAPNALVVVAKIAPANGAQDTPTQAYNSAIPSLVQARTAEGKHLVLVDMYAALGHWSTTLFKDSEHPNDAGYGLMADAWYAPLRSLLP